MLTKSANLVYDSLRDFLYWKYDIDDEMLTRIGECSPEHSYLGLGNLYPGGDQIGCLIEGDNPPSGIEAIVTILNEMQNEVVNENQN